MQRYSNSSPRLGLVPWTSLVYHKGQTGMAPLLTVRFDPGGKTGLASRGTDLLEAARRAGITLASNCSGQGDCGECCVVVLEGKVSPLTREEEECLTAAELENGCRLACCTRLYSTARVRIVGPLRGAGDGGQRQDQDA